MALCNGRINLYRYKRERSVYVSYSRPLLFPFTLCCLFFNLNITIFTLTHACDFAWKIVPLWYQQQLVSCIIERRLRCDLLEKSYLCGINNNSNDTEMYSIFVVICLKNRTFVVSTTTNTCTIHTNLCCDLLEKSYLCGINNNVSSFIALPCSVVICLKNRTFVVSTTTHLPLLLSNLQLWFAWKIVPLWYQQQPSLYKSTPICSCDLLEKSYLCGINNNFFVLRSSCWSVVICLKNRTFVVSTTTYHGWLW